MFAFFAVVSLLALVAMAILCILALAPVIVDRSYRHHDHLILGNPRRWRGWV